MSPIRRFDGRMKIKMYLALLLFSLMSIASPADTKAMEQTLRDLDEQWSKAAAAKDIDKTVSFYSKDAIAMPPNGPSATTKEAIRTLWKDLLTDVTISWDVTKVDVAQSGDIGYTSGSYKMTMNDPSGKPANDRGKYLEVWKKQADGTWKCVMDIWNSDLPAVVPGSPAPGAAEKK
jgi:ketosteroid isomerase-like protein